MSVSAVQQRPRVTPHHHHGQVQQGGIQTVRPRGTMSHTQQPVSMLTDYFRVFTLG